MVGLLDEEYVIQLDDTPPFSWIRETPNRFMFCKKIPSAKSHIHAEGPLYSIARMAEDILGREAVEVFNDYRVQQGDHQNIIFSHDGLSNEAVPSIRNSNKKGILFSAGGPIKKEARENGWEYQSLPKGYPMKFIMPEILGCILSMYGLDFPTKELESFIESQLPSSISQYNASKKLSMELVEAPIIFAYDDRTRGLAGRYVDLLKRNANVDSVAVHFREVDQTNSANKKAIVISFAGEGETAAKSREGGYPFRNDTLPGYLKNAIIAEFASIYVSMLLGVEVDLLELR
ncbi:MAG: hypothetical protein QXN66_03630 [Thermoplasmatales archaeon]